MKAEAVKWLKISLTSNQVSAGLAAQIQEECFVFFAGAGMPEGARLLSRKTPPGQRKDVFLELYLSPVMAHLCRAVAARHLAVTSAAPPAEGTATLLSAGAAIRKAPRDGGAE
jgi:hypothetical protein